MEHKRRRLRSLALLGIMMATLGTSVFDKHEVVGDAVSISGLVMLIAIKVVLWKRRERIP